MFQLLTNNDVINTSTIKNIIRINRSKCYLCIRN